jgi:CDP-glucose 4,6-dehydratase
LSAPERYADQKVLVTGAQGFIGSWLTERLLDLGAPVAVLQRDDVPGSRFAAEGIEERCTPVAAELTDSDALRAVLEEHEVKVVFHLAAQTVVGTANRSPLPTLEANVRGTFALLEACRACEGGIERVVVASSDKAYGEHERLPYREDFALQPSYPYDVSKACADLIARCYAATYDLPVAVTRLANVYGGGDLNWSRIVPDTIRSLVRGERPVIRSDGTPERDYIYVEDAVDAYLAVAGSLDRPDLRGRAWNAGAGAPMSVLDLVGRLIAVSGREVEPEIRGRGTPHGEISRQYLDSTAIRKELAWSPRWQLEEGLRATWEWYERRLDGD